MYVLALVLCFADGNCEAAVYPQPFLTEEGCKNQSTALIQQYKEFKTIPESFIVFENYKCVSFGEMT